MRRVAAAAAQRGIAVGAQVGYRDLAGFGRRHIEYAADELRDEVLYQLAALDGFCRVAGDRVRYVKPHGALYHAAAADDGAGAARSWPRSCDYDRTLPVLCLPGSTLARLAAEAGLRAVTEGFADRGVPARPVRWCPRSEPGALLDHGADEVAARAVRLAVDGVGDRGGRVDRSPCRVESICLHGDTPGAVVLAERVRAALTDGGGRPRAVRLTLRCCLGGAAVPWCARVPAGAAVRRCGGRLVRRPGRAAPVAAGSHRPRSPAPARPSPAG